MDLLTQTVILSILGVLILGLLIRAVWEPAQLECNSVEIKLPATDKASHTLRILLLSDLHAEHFRVRPSRLLKACSEVRPDLVLFAGDLAGRSSFIAPGLDLMRQIRDLPSLSGCPFLAVRGNHDSSQTADQMRGLGIDVLENDAVAVTIRQARWLVIGLEDLKFGRPDAAAAIAKAEEEAIPPERRLVLAHNPDSLLSLQVTEAAVFFAGHFHGGQIWLPFHLEFILLRREKLPRLGFRRGLFVWRGITAYLSRGLGCVKLPLRLFSKPEITVIDLISDPESVLSR